MRANLSSHTLRKKKKKLAQFVIVLAIKQFKWTGVLFLVFLSSDQSQVFLVIIMYPCMILYHKNPVILLDKQCLDKNQDN